MIYLNLLFITTWLLKILVRYTNELISIDKDDFKSFNINLFNILNLNNPTEQKTYGPSLTQICCVVYVFGLLNYVIY